MKKRKEMPSAESLNEWINYDPDTGLFKWIKSPNRKMRAGTRAGTITTWGYVHIRVCGGLFLGHRLAWMMHHGKQPPDLLDHIDRNPSNNAILNLRESDSAKNNANASLMSRNKSGFRGVYRPTATADSPKPWFAHIYTAGKYEFLGTFSSKEEAKIVYDKRAQEIWGEHYFCAS